ncbi:aspartate-alanine antiporter [Halomonas sp. GFAJ-1]|uniref:aspartate-alanine antiporter n=1 Tax=Halomonas sp. GFAJ-1 TaxID=1118153 RepID=UPI00023A387E|nr:aspartate-alanine antiporter [Halomonas sp. GFAJ-1]AVI63007.1 aspartate-alanine antiporter [Halomonas sp. GFAJ-1]EHK60318.1 putative transporter [Halomonas sp. GFAJ-1]
MVNYLVEWIPTTLRNHQELAIFITLAVGYWIGARRFGSFSLGAVTGTLLTGIVVGQLGIDISDQIKSIFFIMFLFAVGFGVGPQFVRGIASDGLPQALFAVVVCCVILACVAGAAMVAGYGPGLAAGLLAGSQTISASIGIATDAMARTGMSPEQIADQENLIPVAYAITYIFGTVGTGWILAYLGPKLLRVDIAAECARYEREHSIGAPSGGMGSAWHQHEIRAFRIPAGGRVEGMTLAQAEAAAGERLFIEGVRQHNQVVEPTPDLVLKAGDVVAVSGRRQALVALSNMTEEVEDRALIDIPVEAVDVLVTAKSVDGCQLIELAKEPFARGVYLNSVRRGSAGVEVPILAQTKLHRGDIVRITGTATHTARVVEALGYADRPATITNMVLVGLGICVGGLIGSLILPLHGVPITLGTSGGALIAGIILGWYRTVNPRVGNVPESTLWFMNSVGLNVFIAVVGISAGPTFIAGLQQAGFGIFFAGLFATGMPMVLAPLIGKYIFRFDPAINLGCCGGARTSTASGAMVSEVAKSNVPMLGYTVPYAVSNTLLTLWGLAIVLLLNIGSGG